MSYLQTFCGTVCYSAPEMLKGEKYAAEKVDVWSLGIILFALLTGELPFDDDDDLVTKHKILSDEPKFPDTMPPDARALISQLLSKRPLLRPTIADILTNPFLTEHAPQQQAVLKLTRPLPFTTDLEKLTLERMRSAGVDIDRVIENVLGQRCDALAGWWALLIEKEERKEKRRERKRREREAETKASRRLSAASSRLGSERLAAPLKEVEEEAFSSPTPDASTGRGRQNRRSNPTPQLVLPDLPRLPEGLTLDSPKSPKPPPPIEKDPPRPRSISSTRRRAVHPSREKRRSRGSTLQNMSTHTEHLAPPTGASKISKKRPLQKQQNQFLSQLTSIKHWFKDSAKRAKSPAAPRSDTSTLKSSPPEKSKTPATEINRSPAHTTPTRLGAMSSTPTRQLSGASFSSYPRPQIPTPRNRASLSPAPVTPRGSYRHSSSTGLRGRKSTSSSVSSIRSVHHMPSHSKASSTSSTSNSVHSSTLFTAHRASRSPHTSVKVLPSTPTVSAFPSNVRLVRSPANNNYNESANFSNPSSSLSSGGLVFAKRKKTPFRGPMLAFGSSASNGTAAGGSPSRGSGGGGKARDSSTGRGGSRSTSVAGRRSGEIIEEEDEEEDEEGEIEEVDAFSPLPPEAEVTIWEGGGGGEEAGAEIDRFSANNDDSGGADTDGWIRRRHG